MTIVKVDGAYSVIDTNNAVLYTASVYWRCLIYIGALSLGDTHLEAITLADDVEELIS